MQNQPLEIESKYLQNDFLFDMDEIMFPEQIVDKFLPVFDSEIFKLESSVLDEIKRDLNSEPEEIKPIPIQIPTLRPRPIPTKPKPPTPSSPPKKIAIQIPDKVKINVQKVNKPKKAKKRTKKTNNVNDVDKYVNQLLREDIKASLKSLEKKYKKPEEDFTGLCEQCGLTFSSLNEYKKHNRSHLDKGKLLNIDFSQLNRLNSSFLFLCR